MAKKFVRNITDTKCKGRNQEPLETNRQNDLLSDEHDVYVRNKDYYHCLTNAIQKIESKNDSIIVSKKDKNTVELEYVGGDGGGGTPGTSTPTEIISKSKYIDVEEVGTNKFELSTEQLEIELEEIRKLIENMGSGEDSDYLGDYNEYDFEAIKGNDRLIEVETRAYDGQWSDKTRIEKDVGKIIVRTPTGLNPDVKRVNLNLYPAGHSEGIQIEKTAKKNIYFTIVNTSSKELAIEFEKPNPVTAFIYPRTEDDLDYINGSMKVKANSSTDFKMTFYTNPNGEVLRAYVKEM